MTVFEEKETGIAGEKGGRTPSYGPKDDGDAETELSRCVSLIVTVRPATHQPGTVIRRFGMDRTCRW